MTVNLWALYWSRSRSGLSGSRLSTPTAAWNIDDLFEDDSFENEEGTMTDDQVNSAIFDSDPSVKKRYEIIIPLAFFSYLTSKMAPKMTQESFL